MSKKTVMDRVRWLFMVLAVGDMASALMAVKSKSVPKNAAVKQLLTTDIPYSVEIMADMAINLKLIRHTLGVGCLFYLESVLNEDFLRGHLTRQGRQFKGMSAHLENLGLGQSIEASGANKIGKAIEVYKIDGAGVGQSGISVDLGGERGAK